MNGGATAWAITPEERGKHDKQFDTLAPVLGYVSGEQARKFFLQSGLPPSVLAEIWNLADMDSDGKMDRQEFSIAMKLIKLKLQGRNLPSVLPITMKQPPVANSAPTIPSSARFGMGSMPNLSVGLSSMSAMSAMPILTPIPVNPSMHSVPTLVPTPMTLPLITSLGNSGLPNGNVNLLTPPFIPNNTVLPLSGFSSPMAFSPSTGMSKANSLLDLGSSSSNSSSTTSLQNINPLTMCLNGVIDAAVNGGLARYQEAFFVKDYIMNHPEDGEKIGRLRELMFEQAHILEYGLAVHEKFVPQDMRPLHKKLVDQFHLMKSSLGIQEFPAYVRASPVHFTNGSPRTCRNSVPNIISPDGGRGVARRSLPSYPAVNRYSSSSLSSQASNEVSNITGQSESSDEVFNMQPSPSTSSLSSNHSASPNVTSSAPSSARGSPQMAEKHKHSRENACLSPRERPVSAIFPNPLDPAQRAPPHQIGDTTLPRSDPNLSAPDKVRPTPSSWSLDSVKEGAPSFSDSFGKLQCPPVPPRPPYSGSSAKNMRSQSPVSASRSPQKTIVPPFTPSPTECQSTSLVSNSPVLSGSYSSGISSLSRCSVSEASGTELPAGDHPLPPPTTLPNSVSSSSDEPIRRENKTPPPYSVYERNNPRRPVPLPHSLSILPQTDPPALPPKPHQLRTGSMKLDGTSDPRVPRPRPLPRKVSQL